METSRIFSLFLARGRRALIVRLGVYNQRTERGLTAEYAESKRIRLRNSELCDLWVSVVLRCCGSGGRYSIFTRGVC